MYFFYCILGMYLYIFQTYFPISLVGTDPYGCFFDGTDPIHLVDLYGFRTGSVYTDVIL